MKKLLPVILLLSASVHAAEWRGLLDVRAVHSNAGRSWLEAGMGKSRYDRDSDAFSVGQAVLRGDFDLADSLSASAVFSADDRHHGVVDVREAWLAWKPLPSGAWKAGVKLGAFFPQTSVEIDYDDIAWTPSRTISSSAINSWIGEELRTKGIELQLLRSGRWDGSPHDIGFTAALFRGNDPTGTLLAWRGWTISDRIAGLNESVLLPDLPVYRPDGAIWRQTRTIHPYRELDGRLGYYAGAQYRYGTRVELAGMHYDNRADPLVVVDGQYGWRTRFDHVSAVLRPAGQWELMMQAMRGDTLMGKNGVAVDFKSWYALASHPVGPGRLALRYDRFSTTGRDALPEDPNDETGHGVALAYSMQLNDSLSVVGELLRVRSERGARSQIGQAPLQNEHSAMVALRWHF
ncbi:hypothetical protein [Massilia endophytica]|uniref:hypothetical protein n=1 Tax=Massilia endophytica TaxID=2899220 RepID=UPI001E5B93CC|nr:hypothetical protein [Massilia endophytica]UGQ46005.1 hypothetical protein LSQ66_19795 [Massilia endophytica]